jgi:hypothetical protein
MRELKQAARERSKRTTPRRCTRSGASITRSIARSDRI